MVDVVSEPLKTITENKGAAAKTQDLHGRLRVASFEYTNATGGTLADGTTFQLVDLPKNKVKILGTLSNLKSSALGASRVIKVGHAAYTAVDGTAVADNDDAICGAVSLATAVVAQLNNTIADAGASLEINSQGGVRIYGTITGGTIPSGATIKGEIIYVVD